MKSFDLKWPKTTATLFSDGLRCRIVWRTDQGMGGAINNNDQCKRRIADSLAGAPKLLEALRRSGFDELATEVAALAESIEAESPPAEKPASQIKERDKKATNKKAAEKTPPEKQKKPSEKQVIAQWVSGLSGTDSWAKAEAHRAIKWHKLLVASSDAEDAQEFHLKSPAKKDPKTWILRRVWPNAKRGKKNPEFFVAEDFKGVCVCLLSFFAKAKSEMLNEVFTGCVKLAKDHDQVRQAIDSWANSREEV